MKHRKLFIDDNNTASAYTYPPPGPDCSRDCYSGCSLSGTCIPIIVYPPPPPPPHARHHISPYLLVFILSIVGFFVFITVRLIRTKIRESEAVNEQESDGSDEVVDDGNRVDHPTWLISTVGLQQSVINSIAVVKYKRNEGLVEGTECSICLNEFREDETLRLLPKCNHAFHVRCIDTWLKSHTNCPLCRAAIASDSVPAQNSVNTTTQIENSGDEETVTEEAEASEEGNERVENSYRTTSVNDDENSVSENPSTSRQIKGSSSSSIT